jgi:hypothetical protein
MISAGDMCGCAAFTASALENLTSGRGSATVRHPTI